VEAMVDADAFRVATLDHTWLPTLPILMCAPMAIIHIAIVTNYAIGIEGRRLRSAPFL